MLEFEIVKTLSSLSGVDGHLIHYQDDFVQAVTANGKIRGSTTTEQIKENWMFDDWENRNLSAENSVKNLQLGIMGGFGIIGSMRNGNNEHKLLIYEFAFDISRTLVEGSVTYDSDTPIASLSLTLDNVNTEPSYIGLFDHKTIEKTITKPGAKINLLFSYGQAEPIPFGVFYADRVSADYLGGILSIEARNTIGKVLADQHMIELPKVPAAPFKTNLENLFEYARLTKDQYIILSNAVSPMSFEFDWNKTILEAIQEMLKLEPNLKIEELPDGTIVIADENASIFERRGDYRFTQGENLINRASTFDDMDSYSKVCVHTSDFSVYKTLDAEQNNTWNLKNNKTLFIEVPDGTPQTAVDNLCLKMVGHLTNAGTEEVLESPFRPQLLTGDVVYLDGILKGGITGIEHRFGREGFYTTITVNSSVKSGTGKISDFISKLQSKAGAGKVTF